MTVGTALAARPSPTDPTRPAVEIRGVSVHLGGRAVLERVDLMVAPGELVGVLGPNGAGKTTLLRTVLGLLAPASGTVTVAGRRASPGAASIGYVPQRHEVAWEFPISVEDAVMTGRTRRLGLLRRAGEADWRAVDGALERVGLTGLRARPLGELSGGQRQRVLIARALASGPAALLLDEPFTGLDMPTQELLTALLESLARDGRAVLMTTHDLVTALHSCDRLVLLAGGVVAAGPTAAVAADRSAWARTFGVATDSPLLRLLEVA